MINMKKKILHRISHKDLIFKKAKVHKLYVESLLLHVLISCDLPKKINTQPEIDANDIKTNENITYNMLFRFNHIKLP